MNGLRTHFTMGLVLLVCALTGHCGRSAPAAAAGGGRARRDLRRMVQIVKHVEEGRGRHGAEADSPVHASPAEPKDLRNLKTDRGAQAVGEWRPVAGARASRWISRRTLYNGGCSCME